MLRVFTILSIFVLFSFNTMGQNGAVSFEEIEELQATEARPIVVLVMTNWCKYCHAMKNTMLKNEEVSKLLARSFRTVFLNAEDKGEITFAGRTFKNNAGTNELVLELGTKAYPALCILNSKNEIVYRYNGYLSPQAMAYTLKKILKD